MWPFDASKVAPIARAIGAKAGSTFPKLPDFIAPQLCKSVERPPAGEGWVHEIKFDGYRIQLRGRRAGRHPENPQGPGLDGEVRRHRQGCRGCCPTAIIDGEVVALDKNGAPDFAALQAALSDGKTDDLVFFAFDLLFAGGDDLRGDR